MDYETRKELAIIQVKIREVEAELGNRQGQGHGLCEDMNSALGYIFNSEGVRVHGILGTYSLIANNWTIDFANNMAYPAFKIKE